MAGIETPNLKTFYQGSVSDRASADVFGVTDWLGGVNRGASKSPAIGVNTGDYDPKETDWPRPETPAISIKSQTIGHVAQVVTVDQDPDFDDQVAFVLTDGNIAPEGELRTATGVFNKTGKTVPNDQWVWGLVAVTNGGGNLWKDPPDFVGTGWTDNGNGTYTCDGTDGTSLEVVLAGILDDTTYNVSINFISYTGGSIDVYLAGTNKFNENTGVAGGGVINFPLTTDQNFAPIGDTIIINSASFVGTIGDIKVIPQ